MTLVTEEQVGYLQPRISVVIPAVNELVRQRVLTRVAVDPLTLEEIEALAVSYLEAPLSPAVCQLLHVQSEGNPFFAEELIRGWAEVGALVQSDKQWVAVTSPLLQALPSSIVGALSQRFSRLSQNIIDQLRIAAVIGRTFDLSLLATVEGQEVEAVEELLLEALRAGLVRTDQSGAGGRAIGIDLEHIRTDVAWEPFAERFFSPYEVGMSLAPS